MEEIQESFDIQETDVTNESGEQPREWSVEVEMHSQTVASSNPDPVLIQESQAAEVDSEGNNLMKNCVM